MRSSGTCSHLPAAHSPCIRLTAPQPLAPRTSSARRATRPGRRQYTAADRPHVRCQSGAARVGGCCWRARRARVPQWAQCVARRVVCTRVELLRRGGGLLDAARRHVTARSPKPEGEFLIHGRNIASKISPAIYRQAKYRQSIISPVNNIANNISPTKYRQSIISPVNNIASNISHIIYWRYFAGDISSVHPNFLMPSSVAICEQ